MIHIQLAGVFARRAAAASVLVGDPVTVEYEPTNPFDANAIAVKHSGRLIGYIPRTEQHLIRPFLDNQTAFSASSVGYDHVDITGTVRPAAPASRGARETRTVGIDVDGPGAQGAYRENASTRSDSMAPLTKAQQIAKAAVQRVAGKAAFNEEALRAEVEAARARRKGMPARRRGGRKGMVAVKAPSTREEDRWVGSIVYRYWVMYK
jgi:hypothetical protein